MKVSCKLAARVAAHCGDTRDTESIRDCVDIVTGGELDATQIDVLTDMVRAILKKKDAAK